MVQGRVLVCVCVAGAIGLERGSARCCLELPMVEADYGA